MSQPSATGQEIRCAKCKQPRSAFLDEYCRHCGTKTWELTPYSETPQGCAEGLGVVIILGVVIVGALGALWGLVALVKWFWHHS
jgi:hypothetical protein